MAYTTIDNPALFFNTVLYTGNGTAIGSGGNAQTGIGFQPDWVWIKDRSATNNHNLFDAVRGVTKGLQSSQNIAEYTNTETLTAFGTDGFTVGDAGGVNTNSNNYVAWNWKAGTTSGLSGGTITPSSYSINATSGFGIYKYTGNSTSGATIAHGLGKVPTMIMVKRLDSNKEWQIYHQALGNTKWIEFTTSTPQTGTSRWNDTSPTSTLFYLGNDSDVNNSSGTYVAYVFCDVKAYCKTGTYTGNGNADGPFIYTGFKPAFLIMKPYSKVEEWTLLDNKRLGYNTDNNYVYPNQNYAEMTADRLDIISNGFKIRSATGELNTSSATMLYIAIAENPFVANDSGTAVPVVAR